MTAEKRALLRIARLYYELQRKPPYSQHTVEFVNNVGAALSGAKLYHPPTKSKETRT